MKFQIENITRYTGKDLIFICGSPGSRSSCLYNILTAHPDINISDYSNNKWYREVQNVNGEKLVLGDHRGNHWGPGNKHGNNFDRLNTLSKHEIISEMMAPYENWEKIKVIWSHWFSYEIDYLHSLFPKAKILSCVANDIDSFYRWHKIGGWAISYPKYTWYQNDSTMLEKIKEENYRLMKFNKDRCVYFRDQTKAEMFQRLGLMYPSNLKAEQLGFEIAIYDGDHLSNFYHLTR